MSVTTKLSQDRVLLDLESTISLRHSGSYYWTLLQKDQNLVLRQAKVRVNENNAWVST